MAVDDLWYLNKRGPDGQRLPSKRHGRGKRWRVRWVDPENGRKRERLFDKKSDADRHDANVHADISRGQYIDPHAGKVTLSQYAAAWRAQQLHRDTTADMVSRAFRLHIDPNLGDLPVSQVRSSHLRAWVKDRSAVLAPSTMALVYGYVSSVFSAAVLDRVIGSSPCIGVRLPEIDREDRFIPTPEQVHAASAALPERYRAVVYVAAGCGLRPSEVFGLEVEHVDFLRREVTVHQQVKTIGGRKPYLGQVKTKTSRRTVELPSVVADALARHIELGGPSLLEMDDETDPRAATRRTAHLMFTTINGAALHRSTWSAAWRRAIKRAGLPEGLALHGLRHYFATLLIHAGASVKTVQLALGHSTPMITLNTYAHEWPDVLDRTRSLVDAALGQPPTTPSEVAQ